jgi:quinolinate synthase
LWGWLLFTSTHLTRAAQAELPGGLSVVPGPAGGEGCSLEGGCASCPYMKMNSLAALMGGEAGGRAVRC